MKDQRRNAWHRHNGIDNLFNGGVIGLAIAVVLLAVLAGPPQFDAAVKTHGRYHAS